ncbi:MAG: VOC family protein [Alphaproteobacteria bacterium]|nr:VOC family protein [Alphaproteobacteria bacterium]
MTKPVKLAHVVFRTNQLETMIEWYRTVLEADIVHRDKSIVFLTYDDEHHRIALIGGQDFAEKPARPQVGFYHVAFTFAGLADLFGTYQRLKKAGIVPWRAINHGPTTSFYYKDPDGNDVELQVDRFVDANEAKAWMHGEAFARNPIGIEFDAEHMIARLQSGEPEAALMRRPDE